MAFAQVEQTKASSSGATDVDPLVATYPDDLVLGDLMLALVCIDSAISGGGTDINIPSGWTLLFTFQEIATQSYEVWARIATGDESGTFNIDLEEAQQGVIQILRISGWWGIISTGIAVSGRVNGQNPPALAPTWGAEDNLWVAVGFASTGAGLTAYPSSYTANRVFTSSAASSGGAQIASCTKELNAASDDPETFNWSTDVDTITIAIRPADSAPDPPVPNPEVAVPQRFIFLQNEDFQPLSDTEVLMYDLDTGGILGTRNTNKQGVADFVDVDAGESDFWFKPRQTRVSGKFGERSLPLTGVIHMGALAGEGGGSSTVTAHQTAGEDDDDTGFFTPAAPFVRSWPSDPSLRVNAGIWFPSLNVPQGVTIASAILNVRTHVDRPSGNNARMDIYVNDVDDASSFTEEADVTGRPRTTASTEWVQDSVTADVRLDLPAITSAVQELVNRPDWVYGNGFCILMIAQDTVAKNYQFYGGLVVGEDMPTIEVIWS